MRFLARLFGFSICDCGRWTRSAWVCDECWRESKSLRGYGWLAVADHFERKKLREEVK